MGRGTPLSVLGDLDPGEFLARHWQRAPLLVRDAAADTETLIDAAALLDLACEEAIESRLVIFDAAAGEWSCEHGPFPPARLDALPAAGWSLLVQNVDAWIPEVAALLDGFGFLPRWRLDDVMVSLAADGGGVGPHFDWYDVFLLQSRGTRRWEIGPRCDARTRLLDHPDLRLLPGFTASAEPRLGPGDLLYLPAGVAHRGTAAGDDCITCSIGFRAPSTTEVIACALEHLAPMLGEDRRYRDPANGLDPDPHRINDAVIAELLREWREIEPRHLEDALARGFAGLVTEPRDPTAIEPRDPAYAPEIVPGCGPVAIAHHASSRFAWRDLGSTAELYVDGVRHVTSAALAKGVCHGQLPAGALDDPAARALIDVLVAQGSVEITRR